MRESNNVNVNRRKTYCKIVNVYVEHRFNNLVCLPGKLTTISNQNLTHPPLSQGDYMTLAQKSPVKQQGGSPNGKAVNSPSNAVLKESYIPKRLLMGDMDMVDHGGNMLGCGSTTSDTSESTSLR